MNNSLFCIAHKCGEPSCPELRRPAASNSGMYNYALAGTGFGWGFAHGLFCAKHGCVAAEECVDKAQDARIRFCAKHACKHHECANEAETKGRNAGYCEQHGDDDDDDGWRDGGMGGWGGWGVGGGWGAGPYANVGGGDRRGRRGRRRTWGDRDMEENYSLRW
jgi:hypothetical protein